MSQPLPDDKYKWVSNDDYLNTFAALQDKAFCYRWYDQQKHYIFEVDMDYQPDLHDLDDNNFLAPKTMNINTEITGEKQHQLCAKYSKAACPFSCKHLCSFFPKRKYVDHGNLFRFYLDRKMMLVKVYCAICFITSLYFEPYINNNKQKRRQ